MYDHTGMALNIEKSARFCLILVLLAAFVDLFVGGAATKVLLAALVVAACLTLIGHLIAVLASSRLR